MICEHCGNWHEKDEVELVVCSLAAIDKRLAEVAELLRALSGAGA